MNTLSFKQIFGKPFTITLVLLLVVTFASAGTGEELIDPKENSKLTPATKTIDKSETSVEKDSIITDGSNIEASIIQGYQTSYKPINQDSIQNSNEVLSFNFIQYMIQRFKLSVEVY